MDNNLLKNEKGQMAIFIALFFQVIFVFFAMSINVGLVVHDKINLQNSVDIAAYYGAMKQAEVLNQLAHINYQMRQNYKLFVWRYRVLGTLGNRNHPLMYQNPYGAGRQLPPEQQSWTGDPNTSVDPSVCVSHSIFQETIDLDNNAASVCLRNGQGVPAVPTVASPVGFVPGAGALPSIFQFLADQIAKFCLEAGVMNWAYSARILGHLRIDGMVRKNMMYRLAQNLSRPDPLDLRNEPIEEGVRKTFELNLTDTNRNGIQDFQYFNSLGQGQCANPRFWMVDIKINPVILFSDWNSDQTTGQCPAAKSVPNRAMASNPNPTYNGMNNLPAAFVRPEFANWRNSTVELQGIWAGEPNDEFLHSSVGFEKNPWCMVYTGVRATTMVRKPFDPTSTGFQLEARGFAKPFGGRFGPWYGKSWQRGNPNSQAASRNQMVDPMLPSRDVPGGSGSGDPLGDVANHSRYPGDPLGMSSLRAMGAMVGQIMPALNHTHPVNSTPPLAIASYDHLGGQPNMQSTGDSLARDGQTENRTVQPIQRQFELGSTSPDVFDAVYYSIEPRYYNNYFTAQTTGGGPQIPGNEAVFDYGSTKDNYSSMPQVPPTTRQFSVVEQIRNANDVYMADYEPFIKQWQHLLTSWHQRGVVDYSMDPSKFGACAVSVDDHNPSLPTPSNCLQGGRTGYSVKNISADFLQSNEHALGGGAGGSAGAILNQPPF